MPSGFEGRKHSEENKKIISEKLKRRYSDGKYIVKRNVSEETKKKISLANKGRKPTEETRKKMSKSQKKRLYLNGGKFSDKHRKNLSLNHADMSGEKSPTWKGGLSFEPYCFRFNSRLKERIRDRDNRTCQLCGDKENGHKLDVHHIHYDKQNCNPDLISLCHGCNLKSNSNRDYYENLFINNLKMRNLIV